jgi:hypothetical protein
LAQHFDAFAFLFLLCLTYFDLRVLRKALLSFMLVDSNFKTLGIHDFDPKRVQKTKGTRALRNTYSTPAKDIAFQAWKALATPSS